LGASWCVGSWVPVVASGTGTGTLDFVPVCLRLCSPNSPSKLSTAFHGRGAVSSFQRCDCGAIIALLDAECAPLTVLKIVSIYEHIGSGAPIFPRVRRAESGTMHHRPAVWLSSAGLLLDVAPRLTTSWKAECPGPFFELLVKTCVDKVHKL